MPYFWVMNVLTPWILRSLIHLFSYKVSMYKLAIYQTLPLKMAENVPHIHCHIFIKSFGCFQIDLPINWAVCSFVWPLIMHCTICITALIPWPFKMSWIFPKRLISLNDLTMEITNRRDAIKIYMNSNGSHRTKASNHYPYKEAK